MFSIIALPYDALQHLPAREFKTLVAVLRWVDRAGRCFPSLAQIAHAVGVSESTACRSMQCLDAAGVFDERTRAGNGRYRYQVNARYLPRWPGKASPSASLQDRLPQPARQESKLIKESRDAQARFAKSRVSFTEMPDERAKWDARLRGWQTKRFWLPLWGPKPTETGCYAPLAALQPPQR